MKRLFLKIYLGISLVIAINILYFIWQPYEKCIIGFPIRDTWLSDLFTNMIYLILYFACFILMFFKCLNDISVFPSAPNIFKMFAALFLLQLPLEIVKFITKVYMYEFRFIVQDICAAVGFLIGILVLFKISKIKVNIKSKCYLFLLITIIFVIVAAQFIRTLYFENVLYANEKYLSDSMFIYVEKQNYQFVCEVLSIISEIVSSLLIFLIILLDLNKRIKIESKTEQRSMGQIMCEAVAYTLLLVVAFLIIVPFKNLILPKSALAPTSGITSSLPEHFGEPDTMLHKGFSDNSINRYISSKYVRSVYSISNISFGNNNMILYQCDINYSMLENLPSALAQLVQYECVTDDLIINFYTFGNKLLIIETEFGYRFIELENINKLKEDIVLTECIKYMLTEGVFGYFEYGCEYLQKYDEDFINTYIERYAKGDFNSQEVLSEYNTDINSDYIQNLAEKIKK